jgi:hypothetical protein
MCRCKKVSSICTVFQAARTWRHLLPADGRQLDLDMAAIPGRSVTPSIYATKPSIVRFSVARRFGLTYNVP